MNTYLRILVMIIAASLLAQGCRHVMTTVAQSETPRLVATWQLDGVKLNATGKGCIYAMPGNTGVGLCDFEGGDWYGFIPWGNSSAYAPNVVGRVYELRGQDDQGVYRVLASVQSPGQMVQLPFVRTPAIQPVPFEWRLYFPLTVGG